MDWLFNNPSTLLWADKIILTPKIMELIKDGWFQDDGQKLGDALNTIFENIDRHGLIEVKKTSEIITPEIRDDIYDQINKDLVILCETFPEVKIQGGDEGAGTLFIDGVDYCSPVLWTLYASLFVSNQWNANIFLQDRAYHFFKYKLSIDSRNLCIQNEKSKAFNKVFSTFMPEIGILPNVLYDPKCKECKKEVQCDSIAIKSISKRTKEILAWRDYDELHEVRQVLNDITKTYQAGEITFEGIIDKYEDTERKLKKRIHSVFPKIERWTNVATILSLPVVIAGISTSSVTVASIGGAVGGLAKISEEYIKIMKSRYKWVGFKAEQTNVMNTA
jgi:hypothetical protein